MRGRLHIHAPEPTSVTYRVLRKRCRKFEKEKFSHWSGAFDHGLKYCDGFRVFRQSCYEWYEPSNVEIIKVSEALDHTGGRDE